jgi:hypothetical protein
MASAVRALLQSIDRQPARWQLLLHLEACLPQVERGDLVLSRQSEVHSLIVEAMDRLGVGRPAIMTAHLVTALIVGPAMALAAHWLAQPPSTRTDKLASADNVAVLADSAFREVSGLKQPRELARQASTDEPTASQAGLFKEGHL